MVNLALPSPDWMFWFPKYSKFGFKAGIYKIFDLILNSLLVISEMVLLMETVMV